MMRKTQTWRRLSLQTQIVNNRSVGDDSVGCIYVKAVFEIKVQLELLVKSYS